MSDSFTIPLADIAPDAPIVAELNAALKRITDKAGHPAYEPVKLSRGQAGMLLVYRITSGTKTYDAIHPAGVEKHDAKDIAVHLASEFHQAVR